MDVVKIPLPPKPALWARGRLTLAAAAVMCLFFASMWVSFRATAVSHFGRIACGKGCRVVAAASEVCRVTFCSFMLLGPVALLLFMIRLARSPPETKKAPAPNNIAEAFGEVLRNPVILGAIPRAQVSWRRAVGTLGADAMFCFLIIPSVTRIM